MDKRLVRISKFISLVLRHKPEVIGVALDEGGWIGVDELLAAANRNGREIAYEDLLAVVEQNDKQRFALRDGRIRANQGHSIPVDLGLEPVSPPCYLYHGTAQRFLATIRQGGLRKMNRQHVHLSPDVETAQRVGQRHGRPVILQVDAAAMDAAGHAFYLSDNGVWLTEVVPWDFIELLNDR